MKSLEGHILNVAEVCQKLLVPCVGLVKLDEVNGDLAGVKKGERNSSWVDIAQIETHQ